VELGETGTITSIGWSDSRGKRGQLFWPERFCAPELESLNRSLGAMLPRANSSSGRPQGEGGLLKRYSFRFWQPLCSKILIVRAAIENLAPDEASKLLKIRTPMHRSCDNQRSFNG